jgi:hypothetical protein
MSRDRAEMNLVVDKDVKAVLEFMWANTPPAKVIGVAEVIPQLARLLWSTDPQEPFSPIRLERDPAAKFSACNQSPQAATESSLGTLCAGDDSVAEVASP